MSNAHEKPSKVNTVLLSVCMLMLTALGGVGWMGFQKADASATGVATLQVSVGHIEGSLMPREEIAVQLKNLETKQQENAVKLLAVEARMNQLEISLARMTGRALSPKEAAQ